MRRGLPRPESRYAHVVLIVRWFARLLLVAVVFLLSVYAVFFILFFSPLGGMDGGDNQHLFDLIEILVASLVAFWAFRASKGITDRGSEPSRTPHEEPDSHAR